MLNLVGVLAMAKFLAGPLLGPNLGQHFLGLAGQIDQVVEPGLQGIDSPLLGFDKPPIAIVDLQTGLGQITPVVYVLHLMK